MTQRVPLAGRSEKVIHAKAPAIRDCIRRRRQLREADQALDLKGEKKEDRSERGRLTVIDADDQRTAISAR
jgi:hypothetical protein